MLRLLARVTHFRSLAHVSFHTDTGAGEINTQSDDSDAKVIAQLHTFNDPAHTGFTPTVCLSLDLGGNDSRSKFYEVILRPYIYWAKTIVRNDTDVVMLTHLLLYFVTSVPSAILLFRRFTIIHGLLHCIMQIWYASSYTLMMHQHIHMRGVLAKRYAWLDHTFPYITDPLMGHTWNSYYFHHVKHHHVEGNGPDDLSSTIRYQRDSCWDFFQYWTRFFCLAWLDLPLYFLRKGKGLMALKTAVFELGNYLFLYIMATKLSFGATAFVFLLPLLAMRTGLIIGNWGQHAFVDEAEPDSDFRSSITLIDVTSNRYCYNDGYHTSHHLNPRRHWREHPVSFLQQKQVYAKESALVFHNINYLTITLKLLQKDYQYLARCLVPMGDQIGLSIGEIAALLKTKTRYFTEAKIRAKFKRSP
jgi:hypothetical protein